MQVVSRSFHPFLKRCGWLGQGESDVGSPGDIVNRFSTTCRDDDILLATNLVHRRCRISSEGQHRLPKELAGTLVEGMEFFVVVGCSDKEEPSCSEDTTAVVLRAGILHSFCSEFGIFAKGDAPGECAFV